LAAVAETPGVERLRFVTSYPRDFTPRMVAEFARHENICPYLHLPVQSGSDRMLKRMGRGYTAAEYLDLVDQLRRARPDTALSTDFIVGFPGETEEDHRLTLELATKIRFASFFAFKYSPRPGTAALQLDDEVATEIADRRLQELFHLQERIQRELNEGLVGSSLRVLVTGWAKQPGWQTGRTTCHRLVHFPAEPEPVTLGRTTEVTIDRALPHSLLASRHPSETGAPVPRTQ
jgi:tRNA-2-methylthio-N6-dimethylallyladenosine synthase